MEVILALPFLILPLSLPVMAGYMARRFGRSFWLWFWISIPLPLISCFIIACLPDKSLQQAPVASDAMFKNLNGGK